MQYRVGTVTVQTGSNVVIGDGTKWLVNAPVAAPFTIEADVVSYQIARVVSDTELRLSAPYEGAGGINLFYSIHTSFTPKRGYPILQPGDVEGLLILNRSVQMIDNDMPLEGFAGPESLDDLTDVDLTGAVTGYALIKGSDGIWRGQAVASGGVTAENVGSPILPNSAAIMNLLGNTLQFKRLVGDGIKITENAETVSFAPETVGEIATAMNLGATGSFGPYKQKLNKQFQFYAFREGSGIRLTREGDEIVITCTVTGGSGSTSFPTTASNVGTGFLKLVHGRTGDDIKFRTIGFDTEWFDVTQSDTLETYNVKGKKQSFAQLNGVDFANAAPGSYAVLDSDGIWRAKALPSFGIKSLSEDPSPKLSAPLNATGQRILGVFRTKTIVIERPKVMIIPIELSCPRNERVISVTHVTGAGTVDFSVSVNFSNQSEGTDVEVSATAGQAKSTALATGINTFLQGSTVDLRIRAVSVDAAMCAIEVLFESV